MSITTDPGLLHRVTLAGKDGLQLAADQGGNRGDPAVVLLHGGGQTRFSWGTAARELVTLGYHVTSLDWRGHGESAWSPGGHYEIDDYLADLELVVAGLPAPPALVGASLGGVVSLIGVGEGRLPRVSALVLVDIVAQMESVGVAEIREFMSANEDGFASLEEAADSIARYLPGRPRPSNPEGLRKNLRRRENGRYYWHWDPAMHAGLQLEEHARHMSERMEAAARTVTIPTLIVRGQRSKVVSEAGVEHLRQLIPQAEYANVADAGHMVAGDNNDQFDAVVESFLCRVHAARPPGTDAAP